jgi:hypothetical protein
VQIYLTPPIKAQLFPTPLHFDLSLPKFGKDKTWSPKENIKRNKKEKRANFLLKKNKEIVVLICGPKKSN